MTSPAGLMRPALRAEERGGRHERENRWLQPEVAVGGGGEVGEELVEVVRGYVVVHGGYGDARLARPHGGDRLAHHLDRVGAGEQP